MKSFWKDYVELIKQSNRWLKNHWKGYLIIVTLCLIIPCVIERVIDKNEIQNNSEEGGI